MISKQTMFKIESIEILDTSMMKLAAFDMPPGETYDPDFLYIRVRAVSAGEYYGDNKNGDWFPEDELKKTFKTFLTAHVFKDHQNKSAAAAIGEVLDAVWDDDMKCVVLTLKLDRKIAPTVTRAIEKGYMTDVSMGCRVPYSICSICGHKAKNPKEYCKHIQMLRRKILPDGRKVYEININPKFHDISIVLNGAEKVAKITDIYDEEASSKPKAVITPIQKIAEEEPETGMQKIASHQQIIDDAFELPESDIMHKHAETEKRAEFYKRLKGDILTSSKCEVMQGHNGFEPARIVLKSLFTPYWSDLDIEKLSLKLKALAAQTGKSKVSVFTGFLNVLDFAGIELAPYEFGKLVASVFNCCDPTVQVRTGSVISNVKDTESEVENDSFKDFGLSAALSAIKAIPSTGLKGVAVIKKTVTPDDSLQEPIMERIVSPLIPLRSMHTTPLVKRIRIMVKPKETSPLMFGKLNPLFSQLYSMYQNERAQRAMDGTTVTGIRKFASYYNETGLEKTAKFHYNRTRALLYGTPVIYAYSKYQRSKVDNGEDINGANRFIAEYPEAVAGMNVLFGPKAVRKAKRLAKDFKKSDVANKIKNVSNKFNKNASFADELIYLDCNGYEDAVNSVLTKIAATTDDLDDYIACQILNNMNSIYQEIDKVASDMENDTFNASENDEFVNTMAIAKILTEKL